MLSKKELLKPRVKVEINFPNSAFKDGEVICFDNFVQQIDVCHFGAWMLSYEHTKDFPKIFKPLSWWEERELSDLPEYVKRHTGIEKVTKWKFLFGEWRYNFRSDGMTIDNVHVRDCTPSDKAEFLNQNNPEKI